MGKVDIDFSDYISITADSIIGISKAGLTYEGLKKRIFIDFEECALNFSKVHENIAGSCIGEKDTSGSNPSVVFYTAPLTTHLFFIPKGKIKELFSKPNTMQQFINFNNKLNELGYVVIEIS